MTTPGATELLIILFIVLLFVGSKKLPGLASSIGTSIKEFRRSATEAIDGDEDDDTTPSDGSPHRSDRELER